MANFDDLLKAMAPVRTGQPVTEVASAARMNAIQECLRMLVSGDNIVDGPNITKDARSGAVILSGQPAGSGVRGNTSLPFRLTISNRIAPDDHGAAVKILDGSVNGEWPDVGELSGDTKMGQGKGYQILNIANIADSNIFIRWMFNSETLAMARVDIYERPNATFPSSKITPGSPVAGATDASNSPDVDPPDGYGQVIIYLGYTYEVPPPTGSPPGTLSQAKAANERAGNIAFTLIAGVRNSKYALLPISTVADWVQFTDLS